MHPHQIDILPIFYRVVFTQSVRVCMYALYCTYGVWVGSIGCSTAPTSSYVPSTSTSHVWINSGISLEMVSKPLLFRRSRVRLEKSVSAITQICESTAVNHMDVLYPIAIALYITYILLLNSTLLYSCIVYVACVWLVRSNCRGPRTIYGYHIT